MRTIDRVFEPVTIGAVTAPNRIYVPAHFVALAPEAQGTYLAARARGGAGMVVIPGAFVHPSYAAPGVNITPRTDSMETWGPLWGPSDIASAMYRVAPKVVDTEEIRASQTVAADAVVLCMGRKAEAGLHPQLRQNGIVAACIGDCVAPREVDDAMLEGFRTALDLA